MCPTRTTIKNVSKYILPAASNLLGLCFLILTLNKIWKANTVGKFIDKLAGVMILIFLTASVLSYTSMRSQRRGEQYGGIADIIFLAGLFLLSLITVVTAFELTQEASCRVAR